jgi:hypothetical protein
MENSYMTKLPKLTLPSLFSAELFSDTRLSQQQTGGVLKYFEDWLAGVQRSSRHKKPLKSDQNGIIMQNKPNLCVFWAVSGDCEEKQTQSNPIQTQNKAIFDPPATPQTQNKPNQTQSKPNKKASSACGTERRPAEEAQANVFEKLPAFHIYRCAKQPICYTLSQIFRKKMQNRHNLAKNAQKNIAAAF